MAGYAIVAHPVRRGTRIRRSRSSGPSRQNRTPRFFSRVTGLECAVRHGVVVERVPRFPDRGNDGAGEAEMKPSRGGRNI